MNEEVWHKIFKDYVDCYNAIHLLHRKNVMDDETENKLLEQLLDEIIVTFDSEINDGE